MRRLALLLLVCPALSVKYAGAGQPAPTPDEKTLQAANLKTDNAALLAFFRSRVPPAERRHELSALVKDLGSQSYTRREKSAAALVKAGLEARAFLWDARQAKDGEVARRAQLCLEKLDPGPEPARVAAAARLLARRKPAGAAEVLIAYFPFAVDRSAIEEVRTALAAVAAPGGKPDPVLVAALQEKAPAVRTAAAEALCRAGVKELKGRYLDVLKTVDAEERLRVSLALYDTHQRESIPALIELIGQLPAGEAWRAEEPLRAVAGEQAPPVIVKRNASVKPVQEAWSAWWRKHAATVDMAKVDVAKRLLGYTLITHMDPAGSNGRVLEMGPGNEVRWQITGLRYPVDAQVVAPDRVLIAEYLGRCVSERDFKGKVIWERQVDLPIACQRLPGNQTFIATRRQLLVVDADGKDVFTYQHQPTSISAARKLPDGRTVVISGGTCSWLDTAGKQVKSFPVGLVYTLGGNVDVLPSGRLLVPEYNQNRVAEYDADGKMCWSASVRLPISATRAANGNTLVVSLAEQRVVELDRDGREVWRYTAPGRTWRARKR
jgi:outer membrane protein assembly factor BamB